MVRGQMGTSLCWILGRERWWWTNGIIFLCQKEPVRAQYGIRRINEVRLHTLQQIELLAAKCNCENFANYLCFDYPEIYTFLLFSITGYSWEPHLPHSSDPSHWHLENPLWCSFSSRPTISPSPHMSINLNLSLHILLRLSLLLLSLCFFQRLPLLHLYHLPLPLEFIPEFLLLVNIAHVLSHPLAQELKEVYGLMAPATDRVWDIAWVGEIRSCFTQAVSSIEILRSQAKAGRGAAIEVGE